MAEYDDYFVTQTGRPRLPVWKQGCLNSGRQVAVATVF